MREFNNVQQSEVALAALDSADIVAMQVGQFRQLLLRKTAFESQFAEPFTQQSARVRCSLRPIIRA